MLETRLQELHDAISEFSSDLVNYRGRVSPYHNNYLYNHLESLQHRFPATLAFLGEENFRFFGRSFLMEHPPMTANIDLFGEDFPHFLSRSSQLREYPFLKDLAQINSIWCQTPMNQLVPILQQSSFSTYLQFAVTHMVYS